MFQRAEPGQSSLRRSEQAVFHKVGEKIVCRPRATHHRQLASGQRIEVTETENIDHVLAIRKMLLLYFELQYLRRHMQVLDHSRYLILANCKH